MINYLQVEHISKRYGEKILFENISFFINKGQKIALIAKNGAGKTTILNIISEKDSPDTGKISKKNDVNISYLEQIPQLDENKTVLEQAFLSENKVVKAILDYDKAIKSNDKKALDESMIEMDTLESWNYEVKIKQILSQLKIDNFEQKINQLSGGQKKRVALANILINEPDLLILDEPTNHLDLEMIEWLELYLKKTKATLLMVTHDRYFLDRICNEIIELEDNVIYSYKGNYSYYLDKREDRLQNQQANIEKAKNIYKTELDWMRRMPQARASKAKYRIDNFYKIKEQAHKNIRENELTLDIVPRRLGKKILDIAHIFKSYGDFHLIKDFSYKFIQGEKIGIVGKNGVGKTTFLNLITGHLPLDKGILEIGETVVFGYYKQEGIYFKEDQKVIDIVKDIAEVIYLGNGKTLGITQFLEHFLFSKETHYNRVEKLSGGEKRRLYLMTILMRNPNFLILDEPTNDFDIVTLNVLENYLLNFKGNVLIVSHDRYFMDKIVDFLFVMKGDGIIKYFAGNYSHYRLSSQEEEKKIKKAENKVVKEKTKKVPVKKKFSFKEKKEFELLENEINNLENEKIDLENEINSAILNSKKLVEKSKRIGKIIKILDEKEFRWLELSELM